MEAVHPMVRTHPVTGWKSVFAAGTEYLSDDEDDDESGHMLDEVMVNELAADEGRLVLDKVMSLIKDNHDLQVRFQWRNPSDMAIWDNRCVFYASAPYSEGPRHSSHVMGVGEKPYLDPESMSRVEALTERETRSNCLLEKYFQNHGLSKVFAYHEPAL